MFTSNKPKSFGVPGARSTNSRYQFVAALNASFDTAESLLHKNNINYKNLKQTKLNYGNLTKKPKIENSFDHVRVDPQIYAKPEFFLMPLPKPKVLIPPFVQLKENINSTINVVTRQDKHVENIENSIRRIPIANPISLKHDRNKLVLTGRVDFCLKMHKVHASMDALWDIYGQLKKISKGKHRGETILLLRNSDGGPVVQCVYYDFGGHVFESGCYLRAVGRFVGENRLHTFKLEKIKEQNNMQYTEHFVRIQNVSSFALLQNED